MKSFKWVGAGIGFLCLFLLACLSFMMPALAMAVEAATEIVPPTSADWSAFLAAIGGVKGATALGVTVVVVQGLLLLFKTKVGELAGKWQITAVTGLTVLFGALHLKMTGMDWASVFLHSGTLAALQVFINQIHKQFFVKDN